MWRDLLYSLRVLRRSPVFAAVAVLSLALGIGANTAIFTLLDQIVLESLPVRDPRKAYTVSLTDDEHKLVFSRLGARLRIAGTAEFNGYDRTLNPARCDAILRRVAELFPEAGDFNRPQLWAGLRPATPSNVLYLGGTPYGNLHLNTGHGTLGWTQACGAGAAVADLVTGRRPAVDFDFCGPRRQ